jgi:hypothetical protein
VFTLADVASGMDAGQAFSALGKKALSSAATAAMGGAFNGLNPEVVGGLTKATGQFGQTRA